MPDDSRYGPSSGNRALALVDVHPHGGPGGYVRGGLLLAFNGRARRLRRPARPSRGLPDLLDQHLQRPGRRDGQQCRDETAEYAADQGAERGPDQHSDEHEQRVDPHRLALTTGFRTWFSIWV